MKKSPGMDRGGKMRESCHRDRGHDVCKSWKSCPCPAGIKEVLQSARSSLCLPVCQLETVTKALVALGMCCFSGIEGAAQNDNWVFFFIFLRS